MTRAWKVISDFSLLLISGAVIALVWCNVAPESYFHIVDSVILKNDYVGHKVVSASGDTVYKVTFHFLVNDILMAFFFAIAGKEVWEAVALKNGDLRGKRAITPLFAAAGGMVAPVMVYLGLALMFGSETYSAVANGWAVPTATDIAFSYLVGRIIFGRGHPAVKFLLLLAIADDAAGLLILAIFYGKGELNPVWMLLPVVAVVITYMLFNWLPLRLDKGRIDKPVSSMVRNKLSFWPYVVAGIASYYGFQEAGIHPALSLVPVVVAVPHADRDFGIFAATEKYRTDLLNDIEHKLKFPVEIILFFFGFANAGVEFAAIGVPTLLVLSGLLVGKPVGILLFGWFAAYPLKFGMPAGMRIPDLLIVGFIAAIGFTVALFVASVAFGRGDIQDAAKMGALLSLAGALPALAVAQFFPIKKIP
ncbi:MAG: Na+/H+ antiporter NhaA [Rhodobacteraceae bacterium]|nr:Na+/H+ antiporter NhaA [Paracoccaceae bacterium]